MQLQGVRNRRSGIAIAGVLVVLSAAIVSTHTFVGRETGDLTRVRVESPNASELDFPVPIPGTELSTVCFKVRNTSPFDSRVTAIGFDLPGDLTGFTLASPADSGFEVIEQVANVPQLHHVTLDFALVTGETFGGGDPHAGLAFSTTPTTFCVSGPFPEGMPIERILDRGVVRVQSVGPSGELGDVAVWNQGPFLPN